jgi:hypothetical protein
MSAQTGSGLDRKSGGGEVYGPEHHSGGGEIDAAAVDDAEHFSPVQGEVARGHRDAKPRDARQAAGTGHVAEAGPGVKMMAATSTSPDGGALAVAAVGESMSAETDDQV